MDWKFKNNKYTKLYIIVIIFLMYIYKYIIVEYECQSDVIYYYRFVDVKIFIYIYKYKKEEINKTILLIYAEWIYILERRIQYENLDIHAYICYFGQASNKLC